MPNVTVTINKELLEDCADALRHKAHCDAGQSQAPDLFAAEDTLEWRQALQISALLAQAELGQVYPPRTYSENASVLAFQQKFEIPMATEPSFLDSAAFEFRYGFMHEELSEFESAHTNKDMHGTADALVDLAYVIHGTALMMGLPWSLLWEEVQRKNMQKVRAAHAGESKRGSALDVVKPAGWTPPDHTAALGVGPWPVFNPHTDDSESVS